MSSVILQVENLNKTFILHQFNQKNIIGCRQVTFSVRVGEFFGITGKSGVGKSTVSKCLYRTYLPTGGKILFKSKLFGKIDLAQSTDQEIVTVRRQEIGYVTQFLKVLPQVTALEIVIKSLVETGCDRKQAAHQAKTILRHFQLPKNIWNIYPHTFSGGEKLRLNLAQAMVKRPRLLLLDEPTVSLDKETKEIVIEMLREEKDRGVTIICVSHDASLLNALADRVGVMKGGRMVEILEEVP